MLGKLMKHEFRATARIMGPLYLVLLVLAILSNFSARVLGESGFVLNILSMLVMVSFGIAIFGVGIMSIVLMVNRFRSNFMQDEGYVMFTLPASVHQLVWSKMIVATVWFVATAVAEGLAIFIAAYRVGFMGDLFEGLQEALQQITGYYAINGVAFLVELLILTFLSCAAWCLIFYAAMAVGHSFANHKGLLSVVFFFVFQFITQTVGTFVAYGLGEVDWNYMSNMQMMHGGMGLLIGSTLVYGAIFYVITTQMLKKRLNLQ